ncbi:hypothetical protein MTR67_007761 [Solanum verrucosum]|uniref:Uncharacterized protein n=1 Tax=Solanum verrucosum TaxID=315347 RepID=A0AAF0TD12_SOLVR|nr:hypothetical protein MTR67_007761 [Solanum verrucosum]
MSDLSNFKFYPMCKSLMLTHLVFVDDLMIFCKGDLKSVNRVMEALNHFSLASRLAGVDDVTKNALLEKTGFALGSFPIRYLGLPLSPKKWNKLDCKILIDKITTRGAIFVLPQSVLEEVDQRCWKFIWGGKDDQRKIHLVAWDTVCKPKCNGGLNVKGCRIWNLTSVGKLLYQLMVDKDSLWVKWVHGIYMKIDSSIWEHNHPHDCSWYWEKLNSLKDGMRAWYTQGRYNLSPRGDYPISKSF